jgi:hypothetical protein
MPTTPPTRNLPQSILLCEMINHRNRRSKTMLAAIKDVVTLALVVAIGFFIWIATPADHDLSAQKQEITNVR